MQVLNSLTELETYLKVTNCRIGCLADTGFLYGLSYEDDRLFTTANDVHDLLVEAQIPIYANVISRLELVDLVFRKQVTAGCIAMFNSVKGPAYGKDIFKLLKDIRDKGTAAVRKNESYKIDEGRLKRLRRLVDSECGIRNWKDFCSQYVGAMLTAEWQLLEQEFGLNYVEIMEGQTSPLFNDPLYWADMVGVMATHGQRGPDAMIVNLFDKSKFPLLITSDSDLEYCFSTGESNKAIFRLN